MEPPGWNVSYGVRQIKLNSPYPSEITQKDEDFYEFPSFQAENTPQNSETVFSLFRVNIFRGHVRPIFFFRVMVTGPPFPFPSFAIPYSLRFPSS